jgi:hypothetical protein
MFMQQAKTEEMEEMEEKAVHLDFGKTILKNDQHHMIREICSAMCLV